MKKDVSWLRSHLLVVSVVLATVLVPPTAAANAIHFSGSATAISGQVAGVPITPLGATGEVSPSGGELEKTELNVTVPGVLTSSTLSSSVVSRGNKSSAESTVEELSVTVGGNTIKATFIRAEAEAKCHGSQATVSGNVEIVELVVNGQPIVVTGTPNQQVPLLGGTLTLNKQKQSVQGDTADMTVTALVIDLGDVAYLEIAKAHADIRCKGAPTCPNDKDFITGGGWFETASKSRATFAVAGGPDNWGHLNYIDHGLKMRIKGTSVVYMYTGPTSRQIHGTCNNSSGDLCYYVVDVTDNGEPGRDDVFSIKLHKTSTKPPDDSVPFYQASSKLAGGNLKLHDQCRKK